MLDVIMSEYNNILEAYTHEAVISAITGMVVAGMLGSIMLILSGVFLLKRKSSGDDSFYCCAGMCLFGFLVAFCVFSGLIVQLKTPKAYAYTKLIEQVRGK